MESSLNFILRHLQENQKPEASRGRTVLTVLYLCVLGLCFIVPVFYYFRMHCDERQARRIRELEIASFSQALEQSDHQNREETRAARRKYREERRARILQLFAPVQMILKEENFPHLTELKKERNESKTPATLAKTENAGATENKNEPDLEQGESEGAADQSEGVADHSEKQTGEQQSESTNLREPTEPIDEDLTFVELPVPGFYLTPATMEDPTKLRLVPNICSICLCNYEIRSDVVWSSNSACEHAFHAVCIEQWLMKQREGPLCPCCRRDFVLDPYDLEEDAEAEVIVPYDLEEDAEAEVTVDIETGGRDS